MNQGTCAEACWYAKEMACHCQCNGKNHGILLSANGEKPARTKRVKSRVYTMASIHSSYGEAGKAGHEHTWPNGKFEYKRDYIIQTVRQDNCKWPEVAPFFSDKWGDAYIVWTWTADA